MTRGGAGSIKDGKQEKDGHTAGLLRASPRNDGTQKKNQSKRTIWTRTRRTPPPSRHGERKRSNPEHNTMTRGGIGSIKDETQEKDGHAAGLLHLRFAMTEHKNRINPNERYDSEREALPLLHVIASEGEAIQSTTQ